MSYQHADGGFDLGCGRADQCAKDSSGSDSAMHDMIDFVILQAEYLSESPTDFIVADHRANGLRTVPLANLRSGDGDWVKIVMPEFASCCISCGIEAEICTVGIPFADGCAVCHHGLFWLHSLLGSETGYAPGVFTRVLKRFGSKNGWSICAPGKSREAAGDTVEMKPFRAFNDAARWIAKVIATEIDRVFSDL